MAKKVAKKTPAKAPPRRSNIVNVARQFNCLTRTCAPTGGMKAVLSAELGQKGKNKDKGFTALFQLIDLMKESNVWGTKVKGYLFKGDISTQMKSAITSFAVSSGWQVTLGQRIIKYGIIVQGGQFNRKYLLIFGRYRTKGSGNTVYCSLTVI